ncbi:BTB/POZ domain [Trinorchestia longiramus]|nr:BTB/POZ domain [Trinorchestia longiramus]
MVSSMQRSWDVSMGVYTRAVPNLRKRSVVASYFQKILNMTTGLLSLKWNNHQSTFINMLTDIRCKESLSDVTLTCGGKFYSLHKFVLSTCSEYFEKIFQKTAGKHPVVVLKDICSEDFEALLHYMYIGEVNVVQERLAGLIKAAECLQIKGLAVPDDGQNIVSCKSSSPSRSKRSLQKSEQEISACRKKRKNSVSSAEEISPNSSNSKDDESQRTNSQTQSMGDHVPTSDSERSSTLSPKKRNNSKDTPNFDCDSELQTNDSFNNNSEIHEVKIEPEESQQFLEAENVEDSKDMLQGQYLQDSRDCSEENHQSSSLKSPQMEDITEWGNCVENAAFESAFSSSYDQPSVQSELPSIAHQLYLVDASLHEPSHSDYSTSCSLFEAARYSVTLPTPGPRGARRTKSSRARTELSPSGHSSCDAQQHKTVKLLHCSLCPYTTNRPAKLTIHTRTHTGEKPFACHECSFRTARRECLRTHMRLHQRSNASAVNQPPS